MSFGRHTFLLLALTLACDESPSRMGDAASDGGLDFRLDRQSLDLLTDVALPDQFPSSSDRCGGGPNIELTSNKIVIKGNTEGANNQFGDVVRCGESRGYKGPQRYYRVELTADRPYRFTVTPSFEAVGYLSSGCSSNVINTDCGSSGSTGASTGPIVAGEDGSFLFVPAASGDYFVAVDSYEASSQGAFTLTVEAFDEPENSACETPSPLELTNGSVSVSGTSLGARNEFGVEVSCGLGLTFDGPQVYYSVDLSQGKTYRLSLKTTFDAGLYVVNSAGNCKGTNVNQDCSNITGTVIPPLIGEGETLFSPPVDGSYLIVVDSPHPEGAGDFEIVISEHEPEGNMTCGSAATMALISGSSVVRGDTSAFINDRGAQMTCGEAPLVGPQSYYRVELDKTSYLLTLITPFDAVLAVGQSCLTLPSDCLSGGVEGAAVAVQAGGTGVLYFTPDAAGNYVVVVDGVNDTARGKFKLTVAEASTPENGSCGTPLPLQLQQDQVVVGGDTGPLANDLLDVGCGVATGPWNGPQAYYHVTLPGGAAYKIDLEPEATFDPALYAMTADTACQPADVNAACTGLASDSPGGGVVETLVLTPVMTTDYLLVVDSWSASEVGTFTLRIQQQ